MKPRYIIGSIIIAAFFLVAIFSFDSSKIEYADIESATTGKTVQLVGSWEKDKPSNYDSEKNLFSFHLKDEKGQSVEVLLSDMKPNNFELAPTVVAKGRMENGKFHAEKVLTKCPSKYEADEKDL